ncbi:MAG: asparagine synthase, partial [Patescibacteria group bacterium]|nr:asparagine synthase [Patescibacteria group bacterium]
TFESGRSALSYDRISSPTEYQALIEKKVLEHLVADVPVGVFFSGGTDSTLIAAILHKHGIDLETFSIEIDYKSEDAKYFKRISDKLKLKSHVYRFDVGDLDSVYEEVMSKMDEPSSDNSIFPTYFVSKKAAEKVKVVLSGEGGDEIFYGYPRSLELAKMGAAGGGRVDYSVTIVDRLYFLLPSFKAKNKIFQKLYRMLKQPISYYLLFMSPLRDHGALRRWAMVKEECRRRAWKGLDLDRELYLEGDLLRKTDFATSYVSIEGRVPLLDIDIVRNAGIVEDSKLEGGVLKAFLKKTLATYISPELVYRSKSGFGLDIKAFFGGSVMLRRDLDRALAYLRDRDVVDEKLSAAALIRRYPHYAFSLVALYRSIENCDNA